MAKNRQLTDILLYTLSISLSIDNMGQYYTIRLTQCTCPTEKKLTTLRLMIQVKNCHAFALLPWQKYEYAS
jgi:hypothetical protein